MSVEAISSNPFILSLSFPISLPLPGSFWPGDMSSESSDDSERELLPSKRARRDFHGAQHELGYNWWAINCLRHPWWSFLCIIPMYA